VGLVQKSEIAYVMSVEALKLGIFNRKYEYDSVRVRWYGGIKPQLQREAAKEASATTPAASSAVGSLVPVPLPQIVVPQPVPQTGVLQTAAPLTKEGELILSLVHKRLGGRSPRHRSWQQIADDIRTQGMGKINGRKVSAVSVEHH
jgi:hypothetical protein